MQTVVQTGLDIVAPIRTKAIHVTEPPWINQRLKSLIKKRQRALNSGDQAKFCRLRNLVNRERKASRGKYYSNKVEHLKECSPAKWWTEVKKLSGMSKATSAEDNIIKSLKHLCVEDTGEDVDTLANSINEGFLAPMREFQPLTGHLIGEQDSQSVPSLVVTSAEVLKALSTINPTKAQGPDGIPVWLLKQNADFEIY